MGNDPSAMIIATMVILLLIFVLRWVFKPSRSHRAVRPVDASDSPNLGLLEVVVSGLSRQDALSHKTLLTEASIRSSLSRRRDGSLDVLVFNRDVERARMLLGA